MGDGVSETTGWLGVGCDLVRVAEIAASVEARGERYLRAVFHADELVECGDGSRPESLAGRFAAKEAVVKALRMGDECGPWTEIAVTRRVGGGLEVTLRGACAEVAEQRGHPRIEVSIAHEDGLAMATAIAFSPG